MDLFADLLQRARSEGKLLIVRVVGDEEPRSLDGVLDGPAERAFVARHVLLAALGESEARALGEKATPGRLHVVNLAMARPMGSLATHSDAGSDVLKRLLFLRTVCAFDPRRGAREQQDLATGADRSALERRIEAQLAAGGWRTAFRDREGLDEWDTKRDRLDALAEMARQDDQLAAALEQHAGELENQLLLGGADYGDVNTWIAVLEAIGAFERMAVVVERLRRERATAPTTGAAVTAAHAAFGRGARWTDLLRLQPDPLAAVAAEAVRARWVRQRDSTRARRRPSLSRKRRAEQLFRRSHELYGALLSVRRDGDAEAVARLVLEAEPTASNHLGLVAAALRVGRRLPIFEEWLQHAASHGEREDAKRASCLRDELTLLPPE